nr:MAG TPA: hypothetical protein [Caudoviricetes sp.]
MFLLLSFFPVCRKNYLYYTGSPEKVKPFFEIFPTNRKKLFTSGFFPAIIREKEVRTWAAL